MNVPVAFLWLAEIIMFAALGFFVAGFRVRKTDRKKHMLYGRVGAILVLTGLVALEFCIRALGWEFPIRSYTVLTWHITVASISFVCLLALWFTGARRIVRVHTKLYLVFFPTYIATLILSLFAFRLW